MQVVQCQSESVSGIGIGHQYRNRNRSPHRNRNRSPISESESVTASESESVTASESESVTNIGIGIGHQHRNRNRSPASESVTASKPVVRLLSVRSFRTQTILTPTYPPFCPIRSLASTTIQFSTHGDAYRSGSIPPLPPVIPGVGYNVSVVSKGNCRRLSDVEPYGYEYSAGPEIRSPEQHPPRVKLQKPWVPDRIWRRVTDARAQIQLTRRCSVILLTSQVMTRAR
jgi:hypothetical protein